MIKSTFIFNHWSADGQFHTDISDAIRKCILTFEFLRPLVQKEIISFKINNPELEKRFLFNEEVFLSSINKLPRDLKLRWFIFTKNLLNNKDDPEKWQNEFLFSSKKLELHSDIFFENCYIFGFDHPEFIAGELSITVLKTKETLIKINSTDIDQLKRVLPIYETNPKHHIGSKGIISIMDLDDTKSQKTLDLSIPLNDTRRYGCFAKEIYEFKAHAVKKFHGYKLTPDACKTLDSALVEFLKEHRDAET